MKETKQFTGMGASSILMIFIILCLTTFGVLSLVSSYTDLRLSERTQKTIQEYYIADSKMCKMIADIDTALVVARREADTQQQYEALYTDNISAMENVVITGNRAILSVVISDSQSLQTTVNISEITDSRRFEVVSYRKVSEELWEQ